jgi:mannose-6-phosphate isomerase-like protein (cupin superfamily)
LTGLRVFLVASLCVLAGGAALATEPAPAVLDVLLGEGRRTELLESLLSSSPLPSGGDFVVVELGRDSHTSHHLVWIRKAEIPHRHDRHDLFVVILRGHGWMRLGEEERAVGEGSILYVPRGTVHTFRNGADSPAAAYALYTPPFDGNDRISEP